jgi:hypothetical protein
MNLDAGALAQGWLAVKEATGPADKGPFQFRRTVHVDQHTHGVRLAATDSMLLLTCWVPEKDYDLEPEPSLDEIPYASATVIDTYGRGSGLLAYLLRLARSDDHKGLEVALRLNVPWQDEGTDAKDLQIEGFEALAATLEVPDRERLQLPVYEGDYPRWQKIVAQQKNTRTQTLSLSSIIVARLAKAARIFGDWSQVCMWFGGKDKPVQVGFGDEPSVSGLVMPCKWDFSADAPFAEPAKAEEAEPGS